LRRGGLKDGFHQNDPGELFAESQARIADLADEIVAAGHQPDDLFLAKAQFAEAILHFRSGAQPLDPDRHAGLNMAERTKLAPGFSARIRTICVT